VKLSHKRGNPPIDHPVFDRTHEPTFRGRLIFVLNETDMYLREAFAPRIEKHPIGTMVSGLQSKSFHFHECTQCLPMKTLWK